MIALGGDHGGYRLKEVVKKYLDEINVEYEDYGSYSEESIDYTVYAAKVGYAVAEGRADQGILICSTGIGISIAANKVKGVRAALCTNSFCAEKSRSHNNANILCLGGYVVDDETAKEIVKVFLSTEFEGGRHQRRVEQITMIEEGLLK